MRSMSTVLNANTWTIEIVPIFSKRWTNLRSMWGYKFYACARVSGVILSFSAMQKGWSAVTAEASESVGCWWRVHESLPKTSSTSSLHALTLTSSLHNIVGFVCDGAILSRHSALSRTEWCGCVLNTKSCETLALTVVFNHPREDRHNHFPKAFMDNEEHPYGTRTQETLRTAWNSYAFDIMILLTFYVSAQHPFGNGQGSIAPTGDSLK